jgi:glucosamine--fructose-6-phosphate aminotransferase (isomerizing)
MCGIVGAVAERNVVPLLIEGLRRLEYRGYDSAGGGAGRRTNVLARHRTVGKVQARSARTPLITPADRRHARYRPHPVGDAWRAYRR